MSRNSPLNMTTDDNNHCFVYGESQLNIQAQKPIFVSDQPCSYQTEALSACCYLLYILSLTFCEPLALQRARLERDWNLEG